MRELPYWSTYSKPRLVVHVLISSKYFDLSISGIIGLNVITMALEFHMMPTVITLYIHTYIHICIAPKIVKTNLKR